MVFPKSTSKLVLIMSALAASVLPRPSLAARLEMSLLPPAQGYSRLLVTRHSAPSGTAFASVPAGMLAGAQGVRMAYESALGNNQYIIKLFDNVSLAQAQAIGKAIAADPQVQSVTVINEHDKVFYGGVSYTSTSEAPNTPAFEFYVPRKGGKNAPLVMAITGAGGSGNLAFLLGGYAEQYGAVVAVMELPADETGQSAPLGPSDTQTLAQKMAANDAAIGAVASYVGQLTGAKTDKFSLYGANAGGLVAERYVFQHPGQINQAVFDMAAPNGPPVPLAMPNTGQPYPSGISAATLPGADPAQFLKVPMQVLLPGSTATTDPNNGWLAAMQQIATAQKVTGTNVSSRKIMTGCSALTPIDAATYCMRSGDWYAEAIFNALFSAPPAGAAPIFLTIGPDVHMTLGKTITLTGIGAGSNWDVFAAAAWAAGNGGALQAAAHVIPANGRGASIQFTPKKAGNYVFRLQATDADKNQVQAFINVNVTSPVKSPLPGGGNPAPGPQPSALAIAGPSVLKPGQSFTLKAVLPAGMSLNKVGCHWHQTSGLAARIVKMPKCEIEYVAPSRPGLLEFQLQVTDQKNSRLGTATHLIQVTSNATLPAKQPVQQPAKPLVQVPGKLKQPGKQKGKPLAKLPALIIGKPVVQKGGLPAVQQPANGIGNLFATQGESSSEDSQEDQGNAKGQGD